MRVDLVMDDLVRAGEVIGWTRGGLPIVLPRGADEDGEDDSEDEDVAEDEEEE